MQAVDREVFANISTLKVLATTKTLEQGDLQAFYTQVKTALEGTNTYVALKAKDGKEFNCIVNGGNLLSMGMTNPPVCSPKGQPVKAAPFGQ